MKLENIMLSEVSQTQKSKGHMFALTYMYGYMYTENLIFIHIYMYIYIYIYMCVGICTYICGKKEKLMVLVGLSEETKECKTGLFQGGIHGSSEGIRNEQEG
jgi:hypothetical protein